MTAINYATKFSGNQWLLIDLASMYGLDKKTFETRLDWGRTVLPVIQSCDNISDLSTSLHYWIKKADEPEMFSAVAIAIWDSVNLCKSGYTVGLDAASSGPQLLSVMTRCQTGMRNTGAIGTHVPDLYTTILNNVEGFDTNRKSVKKATVPHMYGSKAAPSKVFGAHYPEFLKACAKTVPRAEWARSQLMDAWNDYALFHEWLLPDGAVAHCIVTDTEDTKNCKFGKFSYTYRHDVNRAKKKGAIGTKSLAANVTHSYDAYVLRELHRRCNYDAKKVKKAIKAIEHHLLHGSDICNLKAYHLSKLAQKFNTISVVAIEHIRMGELANISLTYLAPLLETLKGLLKVQPFKVRTIHDEFACLPNHCNHMKHIYNVLLVEAYRSTWLFDVIEDLSGRRCHQFLEPVNEETIQLIMENKYALN